MVTSNDDRTGTRLVAFLDLVNIHQTLSFIRCSQLFGQLIVPNATSVYDRFWWEYILR